MERIKEMGKYQKGILLLSLAMIVIFTILYPIAYSKVGFIYSKDYDRGFMEMRKDNGVTIYEGSIDGERVSFRIEKKNTLVCRYGEETYGPFIVRRDPTARPNGHTDKPNMVGVEILEGEEVFFRGGVVPSEKDGELSILLYDERIHTPNYETVFVPGYGLVIDDGKEYYSSEPSVFTILRLLAGPTLIHKADWTYFLQGALLSVINVVAVLFADELFRFRMSFRVRYAELTEPSEWEMISRYVGWTLGAVVTLIIFFSGLNILL